MKSIDRRSFLVGGASIGALSRTSALSPGCTTGVPSEADWRAFADRLAGTLVRPESSDYEVWRLPYNARYDAIRPRAIVRCSNADDVREAIGFVRRFGLAVAPRSGGHSYGGYSTSAGVVIDVGPMKSISVDGDRAIVGAGARLLDVYDQLIARGVAIPAGSCPSVGIAGLTQGGGIGVVDRAFGLTCDNLLSAEVVTADGRVRNCDAIREPELFWAIRGGGGGNFGVATSFTFATHQVMDLTTFSATYSPHDAGPVILEWQDWLSTLPDTIWSAAYLFFGENPSNPNFSVSGVCLGDEHDLRPYWAFFLDSTPAVLSANVRKLSYRDTIVSAACGELSVSECHVPGPTAEGRLKRVSMAASSDFFDRAMPLEGVQTVIGALLKRSAAGRRGAALFDSMAGAIARVAPDATAFFHRGALYSVQYLAYYAPGEAATVLDEAAEWVHGMRAIAAPWSTGGAYPNYVDPLLKDWPTAYYGGNYPRLVSVKAQYDPDQVFRLPQGIPPRR